MKIFIRQILYILVFIGLATTVAGVFIDHKSNIHPAIAGSCFLFAAFVLMVVYHKMPEKESKPGILVRILKRMFGLDAGDL